MLRASFLLVPTSNGPDRLETYPNNGGRPHVD